MLQEDVAGDVPAECRDDPCRPPDEVELVAVVLLGFEGAAQRASEDAEKSIREKMEEVSIMVGSTVASVE